MQRHSHAVGRSNPRARRETNDLTRIAADIKRWQRLLPQKTVVPLALAVCGRALDVAGSGRDPNLLNPLVVTTLAFHEIAAMLGRGELALGALGTALQALQRRDRSKAHCEDDLGRYETQVRRRLEQIRSAAR